MPWDNVGRERRCCRLGRTQEGKPYIQPRFREGVDEVEIAQERLKYIVSLTNRHREIDLPAAMPT